MDNTPFILLCSILLKVWPKKNLPPLLWIRHILPTYAYNCNSLATIRHRKVPMLYKGFLKKASLSLNFKLQHYFNCIYRQCLYHVVTSQSILTAKWFTGFYMMGRLSSFGLILMNSGLTHVSLNVTFLYPRKTSGLLTFSGGIEMWHWTKMG